MQKNQRTCKDFCGNCPSYPGTGEWLFCARGRSTTKIEKKGCLCPTCKVYKDYQLSGRYFCAKGVPP
ncbi:MAG: DUF2769 domain-containing protein [Thermoproteota archaeon]